jgi:hypothetical protein
MTTPLEKEARTKEEEVEEEKEEEEEATKDPMEVEEDA